MVEQRRDLPKAFLDYLEEFKESRDTLRLFQHRLLDHTDVRIRPYLKRFCDIACLDSWTYEVLSVVMGLYGFFPSQEPGVDVGFITHKLQTRKQSKADDDNCAQQLICQMLEAEKDTLLERVVEVVLLAKAKGAKGLDYVQLTTDLLHWGEVVRVRWSHSVWSSASTRSED